MKEARQYTISYSVANREAVVNGLKLSGGALLATDNIGSVAFNKFWGNALGLSLIHI